MNKKKIRVLATKLAYFIDKHETEIVEGQELDASLTESWIIMTLLEIVKEAKDELF